MTGSAIASVIARAQAAQARSVVVAPESAPVSDAATAFVQTKTVTAGRALTVIATGYALGGRTSTGLPVGWGVAAVDPSVIPLGTHMTVPGYGEAVAADVGGAVRGAVIDLWFPTVAQANAWGRRSVTIVLH
jgi:3D (Asp-Asp-Asp) domain-containing protein